MSAAVRAAVAQGLFVAVLMTNLVDKRGAGTIDCPSLLFNRDGAGLPEVCLVGSAGRTSNGYFAFSSGSAQACSNKSAFHGR
jgi:hypothetical protein